MIGDNRLAALAADVRAAHRGVLDAEHTRTTRAIAAGRALVEAKSMLRHGKWLPWLKDHCQLPERTAQLYMQLVAQSDPDEILVALVRSLGLRGTVENRAEAKAAGWTIARTVSDAGYDPFAHVTDDETQRDWLLFALLIRDPDHVEWLLRQGYVSHDEWLDDTAQRQAWRLDEPSEAFKQGWQEFRRRHASMPRGEIEAALSAG
jgi:hypothetical protein